MGRFMSYMILAILIKHVHSQRCPIRSIYHAKTFTSHIKHTTRVDHTIMDLIHRKTIIMEVPYIWHIHLLIKATMQGIRKVILKYNNISCHEVARRAIIITGQSSLRAITDSLPRFPVGR